LLLLMLRAGANCWCDCCCKTTPSAVGRRRFGILHRCLM